MDTPERPWRTPWRAAVAAKFFYGVRGFAVVRGHGMAVLPPGGWRDVSGTFSVLVVDESEAFLASTRHWIESRRDLHLVGTARSGWAALEAAAELRPDLVIVDAVLPGVDGFRLTRALKARANAPLVVIVTFLASAAAREEAFAAGADGFLAKGDFSDELEAILETWRTDRPGVAARATTPAKRAPHESRIVPDP
jgi:CheY-like chemotaxis protein